MTCSTTPVLREIVRRDAGDDTVPTLIAHRAGDDRGGLMIMVHEGSGRAAEDLLGALLDDPLVGWETSTDLNAAGERLDVDELVLETSLRSGSRGR